MDSLCHPCITTTNLSYRFPLFETSATALCGTLGTGLDLDIGIDFDLDPYTSIYIYILDNEYLRKGLDIDIKV